MLAHQIKFVREAGYDGIFAASVFGLFGIFMVVGQLSAAVSDRVGREWAITAAALLTCFAVVLLISVSDTSRPWRLYTYAVCLGLGGGLFASTIFAAGADVFHGKQFGVVNGLLLMGMGVGGAVGPWLGGYVFDLYGSYVSAFIMCLGCFVVACVCVWVAAPRHAARIRDGLELRT